MSVKLQRACECLCACSRACGCALIYWKFNLEFPVEYSSFTTFLSDSSLPSARAVDCLVSWLEFRPARRGTCRFNSARDNQFHCHSGSLVILTSRQIADNRLLWHGHCLVVLRPVDDTVVRNWCHGGSDLVILLTHCGQLVILLWQLQRWNYCGDLVILPWRTGHTTVASYESAEASCWLFCSQLVKLLWRAGDTVVANWSYCCGQLVILLWRTGDTVVANWWYCCGELVIGQGQWVTLLRHVQCDNTKTNS